MFTVGSVYRRREDLHDKYGGQQGLISTPTRIPAVFLFTTGAAEAYVYQDAFQPDGSFWYAGEGRSGDMQFARGNLAIRDHAQTGKTLHLFEYVKVGLVRYVGQANYLGHHLEARLDVIGRTRTVIVFELEVEPNPGVPRSESPLPTPDLRLLWKLPLPELRARATTAPPANIPTTTRRQIARLRSEAIRVYVLRRAAGTCEACGNPAPFVGRNRRPYLEPHHVNRLADGGPDQPAFVAAVCPTCHRRVHHAKSGAAYNSTIIQKLRTIEPEP